jgi:DNA-binding NarL/FixJ family response regulator
MSFDGDLEHLPIVDVIQLLHATGKSGTLTLRSLKGESQLVFHDGYIVSANHVNNSVRIGQILLDMGLIDEDDLSNALREQLKAGPRRKPIIQTMIENGKIQTEHAYQGLEVLIEMTIVEILTWTKGTFSLDVETISVSDEYRYFPEQLKKDIQLNTQSVLMDALRIYDERKREGTLTTDSVFGIPPQVVSEDEGSAVELSAADLGLDELENLERKIPQSFNGLSDIEPDTPAARLQRLLTGIPQDQQQQLVRYLEQVPAPTPEGSGTGVILFTGDRVLRECVAAVCGPRFVFGTSDAAGLDPIIDHFMSKGRVPLLILDPGEPGSKGVSRDGLVELARQERERYPQLHVVVLAAPGDFQLTTGALQRGVNAVLPRPSREERPATFIADTIDCLGILDRYLEQLPQQPGAGLLPQLKQQFQSLAEQREPAEITFLLLQALGTIFERAMTLAVIRSELVAERGIGINGPGSVSSVKLRIPTGEPSLFQQALNGTTYYGDADATVSATVFEAIGAPASHKVLLLPVKSFGRVIAVVYGDFGARAGGAPQPELLEMLALHAGLVIDNALYRKRCAQK